MTLSQSDLDALVEKLGGVDSDTELSARERQAIREVLLAWELWRSFGKVGKVLTWILITLAGLLIAWNQIKQGMAAWFSG